MALPRGACVSWKLGLDSDRGKVITVLMRIWGPGSDRYEKTRRRALAALGGASTELRLAIHWALCLGSYPYFADVARISGQHLSLHGEIQLAEIRLRLVESWGDRAVTRRAAQRILRSMIDWGALEDGPRRGIYKQGPITTVSDTPVVELLVETLLLAQEGEVLPGESVRSHPTTFPFRVELGHLGLSHAKGPLRREREALGSEYFRLAEV